MRRLPAKKGGVKNRYPQCGVCSMDAGVKTLCSWCSITKEHFAKVLKPLKLSNALRGCVAGLLAEVDAAHRDAIDGLEDEVGMWRGLWCDKPEDRLYHAKDRTWWARLHGKDWAKHEKAAKKGLCASPEHATPYAADPPPEIMVLVRAARKVKRKDAALKDALASYEGIK